MGEWHSLCQAAPWWIGLWGIQHHLPYAFPYCSRICSISSSSFPFPLPCLSWLLTVENCSRRTLLLVSPLILHIPLGWSMLMALMALLRSALCLVITMLWATLFLQTPGWWVLLSGCCCCCCLFIYLFLPSCLAIPPFFWSLTLLSSNYSPPFKSMRSWYGWLGISSWRWPTIQGACMVLKGRPTWAMVMMMMMIVVVMRRIRRRLLATNQGRGDTIDYLQSRHIGIQQTSFFFCCYLFFISFCKHLNSVWDKGLYLRTSFYIYAFNWD